MRHTAAAPLRIAANPLATTCTPPLTRPSHNLHHLRNHHHPRAFADQLDNLAGPAFGASLAPYLVFLYFLNQPRNRLAPTAATGFKSLLIFVGLTVVTSILATTSFGFKLADVDWLHADAEQLLSLTNVLEVIGLKATLDAYESSSAGAPEPPSIPLFPVVGAIAAASAALTYAAAGGAPGAHTPFLGGIGDLPTGAWTLGSFAEPANALSIPTWLVHTSSLLEWLVAMGLVWRIGDASGNPRWKGLTWAMIPSHTSGICACVYHFFYNAPSVGYVVSLQALLTLFGNTTLAFAAYRIAASNGWVLAELRNLLPGLADNAAEPAGDAVAVRAREPASIEMEAPARATDALDNALPYVFLWSVVASYLIKYGETLVGFPVDDDVAPYAALLMIVAPTAFNAWKWSERSKEGATFDGMI